MGGAHEHLLRIAEAHKQLLACLADGAPLDRVLQAVMRKLEEIDPGVLCAVLLLDPVTRRLHHVAGSSLPAAFIEVMDGLEIGVGQGSCGAAAFLGERVIVEDVVEHRHWACCWRLAVEHGLRSSWSEPIWSRHGELLGVLGMYYREPRAPDRDALSSITTSAHIASVAIEHARIESELNAHRLRLDALVRSSEELEQLNAKLRHALAEIKALDGLLPICAWCKRIRAGSGDWEEIERYLADHAAVTFTHSICPDCATRLRLPQNTGPK